MFYFVHCTSEHLVFVKIEEGESRDKIITEKKVKYKIEIQNNMKKLKKD